MRQKNASIMLLTALSIFALSSCRQIKINDWEFCTDLGFVGAVCERALTDKARDIEKEDWDRERIGQICMSIETTTEIREAMVKACTVLKCTYEQKELLKKIPSKVKLP